MLVFLVSSLLVTLEWISPPAFLTGSLGFIYLNLYENRSLNFILVLPEQLGKRVFLDDFSVWIYPETLLLPLMLIILFLQDPAVTSI